MFTKEPKRNRSYSSCEYRKGVKVKFTPVWCRLYVLQLEILCHFFLIAIDQCQQQQPIFKYVFSSQSPRLGSMEHLVGSEERLRWESERDRLLARIKELQVRDKVYDIMRILNKS